MQEAFVGGQPGRRGGKEDVGDDARDRQRHEALDEAQVGGAVARPEPAGERERGDEVARVDQREGDVPAAHRVRVVEMVLQPFGRRLAEEDGFVEIDHRVEVHADAELVGGAPGDVVGAEDDHHRRPVDDQLQHLPGMAPQARAAERPAHPGDDQLPLDRDPVVVAPDHEADEVERERDATHRRPVAEVEYGLRFGARPGKVGGAHPPKPSKATGVRARLAWAGPDGVRNRP